jgi:hypothetical protein
MFNRLLKLIFGKPSLKEAFDKQGRQDYGTNNVVTPP